MACPPRVSQPLYVFYQKQMISKPNLENSDAKIVFFSKSEAPFGKKKASFKQNLSFLLSIAKTHSVKKHRSFRKFSWFTIIYSAFLNSLGEQPYAVEKTLLKVESELKPDLSEISKIDESVLRSRFSA